MKNLILVVGLLAGFSTSVWAGPAEAHKGEIRNMIKDQVEAAYLDAKVEGMLRLIDEWSGADTSHARDIVLAFGRLQGAIVAEDSQGIGVMVLVDTSGSMDVPPRQGPKGRHKKIASAQQAAARALSNLKDFALKHPERKLQVGLATFASQVQMQIAFQPMSSSFPAMPALKAGGGTAIGEALILAKESLDAAGAKQQHIVLITDGENSEGVKPLPVIQAFNLLSLERFPMLHFIAFDIGAERFRDIEKLFLKKVYEAADAQQLDSILDSLLADEILAESKSL